MSHNGVNNPEVGEDTDRSRNPPVSVTNQQSQPSQEESNFGDSSGPLFSMYSKAAEDEDNKMADRWQKDAEGILIFTGLFSAAVAALLAVTVQNLIPNSQDTSAFHLGNIYGILADPNALRASTPPLVAKPTPFSPPRSAIWVNSLWFLSLVISLTCALLATSSQQWARRYIRVTQPARCSPEKRARMRAFFATGVEKMHIAWAVEGLPTLLHLSVFLFFAGLVIFLFNINHTVFSSVVWWIGIFSIIYGLITVLPIIRHDSPYFSPLSLPAWSLYASISYLFFKILFSIRSKRITVFSSWKRLRALRDRYRGWILGGVEKAVEETAPEWSSGVDAHIFGWTLDVVEDDDGLEEFFAAIPGFFNSKLVKVLQKDLPKSVLNVFWGVSDGFVDRTLLSNSVIGLVKSRRLDIGMNAMSVISILSASSIPRDIFFQKWDQAPQDVEMGHVLARWCTNENEAIAQYARCVTTRLIASVQERDDRWIKLAEWVLGQPKFSDYVAHGNNSISLSILISVARQDMCSNFYDWGVVSKLSELDIHNTLPELQHDFCTLWNRCVQEASNQGYDSYPLGILRLTRLLYIGLHEGTHAAPTHFSASTPDFDDILYRPQSYPSCDIQDHRPDSIISDSPAEIGETSQPLAASSIAFPIPVIHALGPVGNNKRQDLATPWVIPDIDQIPFTAPTSFIVPTSAPPVLNKALTSYNAGSGSTSKFSLPTPSTISTSPSSLIPPLPNEELLFLLSTSLSSPPNTTSLPRLRPRGLINEGNMCFANVALQLLVYCPQFWNQLRYMGRLIGQRGEPKGQQTSGSRTVLVDATFRLLDEFVHKENTSLTQRSLQLAQKGKAREDVMEKKEDNPFVPTYVYDAMKEKKQFKSLLNGRQQDAEEFFWSYLVALDEEIFALFTSISTHKPLASSVFGIRPQSDEGHWQTEVGMRHHITNTVKAPISCIFDGTFRTTMHMPGQPDTVTIEERRSLQLDIQPDSVHTVQDALAHISWPQVGPSGPSTGKASQQVTVLIEALPPVLVLHLKRFSYDAATGGQGVVKNRKPVQFSPELEIPPDIMVPTAGRPGVPARYTLYGVLYHHGTSASGGHYTVGVLHPNPHDGSGEVWLHVDDESVSTVRHEDVFGKHGNEWADDRCAYLLFYRHTTSTQT